MADPRSRRGVPDSDVDRDAPTPKQSGNWEFFSALATSMAIRLEAAAIAKASTNMRLRDLPAVPWCRAAAIELRAMVPDFQGWQNDPEKASRERATLGVRLIALVRDGEELLTRMPRKPDGSTW